MSVLYFIVAIAAWLFLTGLRALSLSPSGPSQFELQRLAAAKDHKAQLQQARNQRLPDLLALRYVVETTCLVVLISLLIGGYGLLDGFILSLLALLLIPVASKVPALKRLVNRWYQQHEAWFVNLAMRGQPVLRWLRPETTVSSPAVHSKQELIHMAKISGGVFNADQLSLLQHGLTFGDKQVKDIMVPRSAMNTANVNDVIGPILLDELHKTGHSRFPVIKGDIDHVVGMLYMHDLVPLDRSKKKVAQTMRPEVFYVREDQTLEHALYAFLRTRHHLFIVVNAYRETVGILSLEDVIETLLGRKIVDEFDAYHDLRAVAETNPRKNNQPNKREDI